jgi:hypothetical protein
MILLRTLGTLFFALYSAAKALMLIYRTARMVI